jgi:hypothetical protein
VKRRTGDRLERESILRHHLRFGAGALAENDDVPIATAILLRNRDQRKDVTCGLAANKDDTVRLHS